MQTSCCAGKLFHDARAVGLDEPPRQLGVLAGTGAMAGSSDARHAYRIHAGYGLPLAIAWFDAVSFEQTGLVALDLFSTDLESVGAPQAPRERRPR